jgi:hypothetical protein
MKVVGCDTEIVQRESRQSATNMYSRHDPIRVVLDCGSLTDHPELPHKWSGVSQVGVIFGYSRSAIP